MLDKNITEIKENFSNEIKSISSIKEIEEIRIKYFSRNGLIAQLFEQLKEASKEEKPELGKKLNIFRNDLTSKFDEIKEKISSSTIKRRK